MFKKSMTVSTLLYMVMHVKSCRSVSLSNILVYSVTASDGFNDFEAVSGDGDDI